MAGSQGSRLPPGSGWEVRCWGELWVDVSRQLSLGVRIPKGSFSHRRVTCLAHGNLLANPTEEAGAMG